MRLRFHGAVERVTGSCYELIDEALNVHILIDCGMVQGDSDADAHNSQAFPFDPAKLTHVVLTHAHADHSGLLPKLYAEGYCGSIYALDETRKLAEIVQKDICKHEGAPYNAKNVKQQRWHEPSTAVFGKLCPIATNVFLLFFRSGHIVGATSVMLLWGEKGQQKSITFSGDVGPDAKNQEALPLLGYRMTPYPANYLVVESTYGGTVRPPMSCSDRLNLLANAIDDGLFHRQGTVLIPCFALERTQDVLCDLTLLFSRNPEKYQDIPVFIDGVMSCKASKVMANAFSRSYTTHGGKESTDVWLGRGIFRELGLSHKNDADRRLVIDCVAEMLDDKYQPKQQRSGTVAAWRRIWQKTTKEGQQRDQLNGPAIVIAGQGMCEGGPIQAYLGRLLTDPSNSVVFTGYAGPATVAGKLLSIANMPNNERKLSAQTLNLQGFELSLADVEAKISSMTGYSGHADQAGLLDWMWSGPNENIVRCIADNVIITHGAEGPRQALASAIARKAGDHGEDINVIIPTRNHDWLDLDNGTWLKHDVNPEQYLRSQLADRNTQLLVKDAEIAALREQLAAQQAGQD